MSADQAGPSPRRRWGRFWRLPGAAGVAIALVTIPLIAITGEAGVFVALAALCLYPILDVPRTLARPSWWRAAIVSAIVWVVVFVTVVGIADSVGHLGEGTLAFLLPFMLYPMALGLAGLVRLEGRLSGRPPESGPRIAFLVITTVCGLLILGPVASGMSSVLIEKITGDSPRNWVYSRDGEVIAVTPGQVSVRLEDGSTEVFWLGPETRFDYRGPGSPRMAEPASPASLEVGRRVGVEYVNRNHESRAESVNIWVDRTGCAGDVKWTSGLQQAPLSAAVPSLSGTAWESWVGARDIGDRREITTFEFLDGDRLAYQDTLGARQTDAHWKQSGPAVMIEINDCYALYEGQIGGDGMTGEFTNEVGMRAPWTARRKLDAVPAQPRGD